MICRNKFFLQKKRKGRKKTQHNIQFSAANVLKISTVYKKEDEIAEVQCRLHSVLSNKTHRSVLHFSNSKSKLQIKATNMGNTTSSSYPAEYATQLEKFERVRYWTLETVNQLEKMNMDRPIKQRPESDRSKLKRRDNPLQRLQLTFSKFSGHFVGINYGDTMDLFSRTFKNVDKHSINSQTRSFERAIMPMKVWAMETHPALLREIKRCEQLKKSWKQVQDATKTSKDPKLQKRMQHAKELYEAADAQCKAELDKTEKLFRNQTLLWKMYQDIQLEHCRYVESRIRRSMDSITTKEDKTVDL